LQSEEDQPDLSAVNGGDNGAGIPDASFFIAFAEAVIAGDPETVSAARIALAEQCSPAAATDAAAVAALFNAINRVADAIGIQVEESKEERTAYFREALDLDSFQTARMEGR
jgi:alkylhydroperoxidase family enzyme